MARRKTLLSYSTVGPSMQDMFQFLNVQYDPHIPEKQIPFYANLGHWKARKCKNGFSLKFRKNSFFAYFL